MINGLVFRTVRVILKTEKNDKFKGKYGDPFLNSPEGSKKAKDKSARKKIDKQQNRFIKGYANFLGQDFLAKYGKL